MRQLLSVSALVAGGLILGLLACSSPDPTGPDNAGLVSEPANFPPLPPSVNPPTAAGVKLGRQLFYDPKLSATGSVSCATCHDPAKAFSDGVGRSTLGVSGHVLPRHSPALINLAWATNGLFWDGGSKNLESQALGPLTNPDEMGHDLVTLANYLKNRADYQPSFAAAFPGEPINYATVAKALAQFERTLVSAQSPYDQWVRNEGAPLSGPEQRGRLLYQQHCAACHATDLFTDQQYHNNGLDRVFSAAGNEEGLGRERVTFDPADRGKYRTPTLRNVALTAPYMHDGRLRTLEEVIGHYSEGINPSETLDSRLPVGGFQFTANERADLLAFLNALTDRSFITNPRHRPE